MSERAFGGRARIRVLTALGLLLPSLALDTTAQSVESCGAPATPIHVVQGDGRSSPLAGLAGVSIEGVVVGAFQGFPEGLGGFFVQEEDADADGDPLTSDGIFVFDGGVDVDLRVGDTVRVRGTVREFFGLTELGRLEAIVVCASQGAASAAEVKLPVADPSDWERWEGMRVRVSGPLTLSDTFGLGRYGELLLSAGGRLWQPTQHAAPGDDSRAVAERNARHRVRLDDGSQAWRPRPVPTLFTSEGDVIRLGDRVDAVEGVVDFAFGEYRLQPTAPVTIASVAARHAAPPPVSGALRIAAWNVENFFNGDGRGGGFPTRGASDPEEQVRQRAKLVAGLVALDAHVLALVEMESDGVGPTSAARELIDALAHRTGVAWALVDAGDGALGEGAVSVALAYRPDRVEAIGAPAVLGEGDPSGFDAARNRPVLAQSFRHHRSGESFTLAVAHLKSKGSACSGDPDTGDGQGECSGTRRRASEALVDWLAGAPTGVPDAPPLVVGDLNAYPREDALAVFSRAGYVDLLARFTGADAYTYVFDGAAGRLDHALASAELAARVRDAAVWHVAADAPPLLGYESANPRELYTPDATRASDHDPVLVGLFPPRPGCSRKSLTRGMPDLPAPALSCRRRPR